MTAAAPLERQRMVYKPRAYGHLLNFHCLLVSNGFTFDSAAMFPTRMQISGIVILGI